MYQQTLIQYSLCSLSDNCHPGHGGCGGEGIGNDMHPPEVLEAVRG